jgi:uncharacterized membrane protein YfcA
MDLASASTAELIGFAALILGAGIVAGLLAGLFGIGGGAVVVPVLYQVFTILGVEDSVRMHLAIGTSIAVIVPTSIRSYFGHYRLGVVDTGLLRSWVVAIPVGVIAASLIAALISGAGLRGLFAVLALLFGVRFLIGDRLGRLGADLPGQPAKGLIGVAIGFFSTLMGIGGGTLNNTFMTLYGRPMLQAVATSAGVGVLISVPALAGYIWAGWGNPDLPQASLGFVNLAAAALLAPATILSAPYGVRIAHALDRRYLEIGFGLFLLVVAARFAASLF